MQSPLFLTHSKAHVRLNRMVVNGMYFYVCCLNFVFVHHHPLSYPEDFKFLVTSRGMCH